MQIKSMTVSGLFGKEEDTILSFNPDLNIMTGRNGSGKTTLIKLAWFIMSGNILLALKEIKFAICILETTEYTCKIIRTGPVECKIELNIQDKLHIFEDDDFDENMPWSESAEDKANSKIIPIGGSIFFPTFRRIEGGFSMPSGRKKSSRARRPENEIDQALYSLARNLSNEKHTFVSAISTQDIVRLLLQQHATFSDEINSYQADVSKAVIQKLKDYDKNRSSKNDVDLLLDETRLDIEGIETFRSETMKPLDAVRTLVEKLFQHSGITFDKRLSFGDAAESINSEELSAGEKQMLSFICYNAFLRDSVIFIDEPELSLHVDWQRQLYPILEEQGSNNQFVFSTHSPFIYGKYPDKEVCVGIDRGE